MILDYAWGRPGIAAMQSAGVTGVLRYVSHDQSGKTITAAEWAALDAAGIAVGLSWEDMADAWTGGYVAGIRDGKAAADLLRALGRLGPRPVVYAAVDSDPAGNVAAAVEYARGFCTILGAAGGTGGVYGGLATVRACLDAGVTRWAWQTRAWSGTPTVWDPRAVLRQTSSSTVAGASVDTNTAPGPDWGQSGVDMPLSNADVQAVATAVWQMSLPQDSGVGPAAALSWLEDIRVIVGQVAGAVQVMPNAVWAGELPQKAGIGPAAAADWLRDTRIQAAELAQTLADLGAEVDALKASVATLSVASGAGPLTITLTGAATPQAS